MILVFLLQAGEFKLPVRYFYNVIIKYLSELTIFSIKWRSIGGWEEFKRSPDRCRHSYHVFNREESLLNLPLQQSGCHMRDRNCLIYTQCPKRVSHLREEPNYEGHGYTKRKTKLEVKTNVLRTINPIADGVAGRRDSRLCTERSDRKYFKRLFLVAHWEQKALTISVRNSHGPELKEKTLVDFCSES